MEVSDYSLSLNPNPEVVLTQQTPEASKKRKVLQKTVVTVRIGSKKAGKLKNEGPPPDFWSWRKYGQKPIKGSPFPRGYYRCSTSKGCSAKKQVERSKTDGSMFIITYTSSHNHPGPSISTLSLDQQEQETQPQPSDQDLTNQEQEKQDHDDDDDEKPSIIPSDGEATEEQSSSPSPTPLNCSSKEIAADEEQDEEEEEVEEEEGEGPGPLTMEVEKPVEDEQPNISYSHQLINKSEENDFFDELEELPTPPSFSSFMRSYFFDEIRIPAAPS